MGCNGSKAKPPPQTAPAPVQAPIKEPAPEPVKVPPPPPVKKEPEIDFADEQVIQHDPIYIVEKTQPSQYQVHPEGEMPKVPSEKGKKANRNMPQVKSNECCEQYVCYGIDMEEQVARQEKNLMPLKAVKVNNEIRGAFVTTQVELTYINPSEQTLDCFYSIKQDDRSFVKDFEASVETDSAILPKQVFKSSIVQQADGSDQVDFSNLIAVHENDKSSVRSVIYLQKLQPRKLLHIKLKIISQIDDKNDQFYYDLPKDFYPDYTTLMDSEQSNNNKLFNYSFECKTAIFVDGNSPLYSVDMPENASVMQQNKTVGKQQAKLRPSKEQQIKFRTKNMILQPQLQYARSENHTVAVAMTLVLNTDIKEQDEDLKINQGDAQNNSTRLHIPSEVKYGFTNDESELKHWKPSRSARSQSLISDVVMMSEQDFNGITCELQGKILNDDKKKRYGFRGANFRQLDGEAKDNLLSMAAFLKIQDLEKQSGRNAASLRELSLSYNVISSQADMAVSFKQLDPQTNQIVQSQAKFARTDQIVTIDKRMLEVGDESIEYRSPQVKTLLEIEGNALLKRIAQQTKLTNQKLIDEQMNTDVSTIAQAVNDVPISQSEKDLKLNKLLNCVVPGTGTIRATMKEDQIFTRSSQLWVGLLQLVSAPTGLGWYWSIKHNQKLEANKDVGENLFMSNQSVVYADEIEIELPMRNTEAKTLTQVVSQKNLQEPVMNSKLIRKEPRPEQDNLRKQQRIAQREQFIEEEKKEPKARPQNKPNNNRNLAQAQPSGHSQKLTSMKANEPGKSRFELIAD